MSLLLLMVMDGDFTILLFHCSLFYCFTLLLLVVILLCLLMVLLVVMVKTKKLLMREEIALKYGGNGVNPRRDVP